MAKDGKSRFDRLVSLTPRRFHISANPPFGVGLVMCGHTNLDETDGSQFFHEASGIPNCKPGIWTSTIHDDSRDDGMIEFILRWVAPGSIDLDQSVEDWEKYEQETRKIDADAWEEWMKKNGWEAAENQQGVKWRKDGSYYDDGGLCNIISTEYLTTEAYEKILAGEKGGYGYYVETLTLSGMDGEPQNSGFCIGGVSFGQDAVGGPPKISLAEENGQVVALRMHAGDDEDDEEE